jgi:uracil-DNA glycosylase family 4
MDAKQLLRRYIEQRRELGESELVLDSLNVEDVLRVIGAAGASQRSRPVTTASHTVREFDASDTRDWRTSLRDAGVNVETPAVLAPLPIDTPEETESPSVTPTDDMAFKKGIVVGADEGDLIPGAIAKLRSLDQVAEMVKGCKRCPLYKTAKNPVPGEGDPHAQLVCVGEAPGAKEDETGRPFIGQAGQLLTKILAAVDLSREQVFIVNVLKHRPPSNRNPLPDEVEACSPYLIRQLELIKPKVIVAFGTFAAQTLLNTKTPLGQLRGLVHRYHGIPLIVTYHPAALLRNPAWKRPTWEDVKLARRILDSAPRS